VWNDHPSEINIYIAPPWWQTWWFRLLLGLAGILLLGLGIREYTQRKLRKQKTEFEKLRAIEQERIRIARDMHDDLGSGLSTIRLLSEVAKQKLGDEKPPEEIDKIVNSSSELTEKMSEIVWALNSQNDTLESLIAYIRAYAMKYFDEIQLDCKVSMPEKIPSVNLSGEQRRNIFLCVKESLHNIVKHSGATQIEIRFLLNGNFKIEIHDNGQGIDLDHLRQFGNGLKNMQSRMEIIGGSFAMKNEQGTTCAFTVPLLQ
jgi:signal transduction histidine kinase